MSHGRDPAIERIVLVGFMAAGKTTVGRLLADRLAWSFVDLDDVIQGVDGREPAAIIRQDGEAAFRALEARVAAGLGDRRHMVLATGGGWGERPELAAALGPGTLRVWLKVSARDAVRRAQADAVDRPMLGAAEGRVERAEALLARREPGYASADLVVDATDKAPIAVADEILATMKDEG